ncbi:MAG TPA: acyltransferase, partial [Acidobacteriaceae bacterium]|nr:acyltransferase [Acidobacteriaceae bacterium]
TSTVLMASLARLEAEHANDRLLFLAFWNKRLFRIYPLAIATVVLVALFHIPADPDLNYVWIGIKGFVSNLLLVQNLDVSPNILSPLWSLPLEVQMYVLLPFAYLAIRHGRRFRSLWLWALSLPLAVLLPKINWRLEVFSYAPCFVSGIVAFDLIKSRRSLWKLPAWVWPLVIAAAVLIFGPNDNLSLGLKMHRAWAVSLLLGVGYAFTAEGSHNWIHAIFHWIAEHSYGIYLSHLIVFWIVFRKMAGLPWWMGATVLVAGSLGIPALAYVGLEKPLILVGNHMARRLLRRHALGSRRGESQLSSR